MVKRTSPAAGFTLTEAMLVVAIIGTIALIGPQLFTRIFQFYTQNTARVEIQRDLRVSLDLIDRKLRQASAASVSVSQLSSQPPYSSISFTTVDGSTVTYSQSGHNLLQTVNGKQKTLSPNLQYLAFTYPQTDINTVLSVSITMQKTTFSGRTAALQMAVTKVRVMNP